MKAILIKYLAATNHKPSRLKAIAEGCKPLTKSFDHSKNDGGCNELTREFITKMGWKIDISGTGSLPNGDFVATLSY